MKTTLFWLKTLVIAIAWAFMLSVLITVVTSEEVAVRKWIAWLLLMGHALALKPLGRSLIAEYMLLKDAIQEPFIVTGTGHRS